MAGRILIADNVATNRIILRVRLTAARYEILQADSGLGALDIARRERPDLVILDASLADDGAAKACAGLKADPLTRAIPVLIVDAVPSRAARLAAFRAGADDYTEKPHGETALLALVRNLMRARATFDELVRRQETVEALGFAEAGGAFARQPRVALIAPTPETGLRWRRALGLELAARLTAVSAGQALGGMDEGEAPDAFIIAADLATTGDGLRLVSELRSRSATRHTAIVIQDEANEPGTLAMALDLGANAVAAGRFDPEELAARLERLLARKLETDALRASFDHRLGLAMMDPLTGLYNRRYAEAYLNRIAEEASQTGQPFALMLLDLDRFKEVNDTHGHLVGDAVLVETARRLTANLREIDLLARFGGEEFVIALPETDLAAASIVAERLRRVIAEAPTKAPGQNVEVPVTISIGVAVCTGGDDCRPTLQSLFQQADTALYASKSEGRNQVTFAGDQGQAA